MTDQLERAVSDALAWRADRTTVPTDVRFDGRQPGDAGPTRARVRWLAPLVPVAVAAIVAAGLAAIGQRDARLPS